MPTPLSATELTGVVLAGGASSRLGRDKAELILHEGGVPLFVETANLLRRVVPKVVISGRPGWTGQAILAELSGVMGELDQSGQSKQPELAEQAKWSGKASGYFPGLPDDIPGKGPVGAITTALRHSGTACLILACDLPFMQESVLRLLVETWLGQRESENNNDVSAETKDGTGKNATNNKGRALVTAFMHQENDRIEHLAAIYEPEALRYLEPSLNANLLKIGLVIPKEHYCLIPLPPDLRNTFTNINNPADLETVRKMMTK